MSQLARQMAAMYTTQQEQYLNSICDNIESLTGDSQAKLAWTAINRLTGRKSRSNGIVTAEDSIDRLKQWHAHFKTLLSPETPPVRSNLHLPRVFHDLYFRTGEFTTEELDTALSALSSDKAAGVDEVVNEILRRPELSECILEILNMCYLSKAVPNEWHISLLIPVFKKGNPSMCTNYRGIALMSACAKLYNRLPSDVSGMAWMLTFDLTRTGSVLYDPLAITSLHGEEYMRRLLRLNLQASTLLSLTSPRPLTLSTGIILRIF